MQCVLRGLGFAACLAMLTPALAQSQSTEGQPASLPAGAGQSQASADFPPPPPEDTLSEPARLSDVEGSVQIFDHTGKLFDQARQNMELDPGMSIETGNDGRAEIEFPDGSVARVTPNSGLVFAAFNSDPGSSIPVTLKPDKGLTYYEFAARGSQVGVEIGKLWAMAARGAGQGGQRTLLRVSLDARPYEAAVLRGTVHIEDAGGNASYDLTANESARIDPNSATDYDTAQEVTPDSWDSWNADRDSALAELAGAGARSSSGEPGTAGWSDLDYYGSWYNVPGQGLGWAPDGVGQDFDPYGSGAWGYYTDAGYAWTSTYPWGWLPYHCGFWNYYDGNGWLWMPNGCSWGNGTPWYPYSGVHNQPHGYRPPHRPEPPRGVSGRNPGQMLIPVNRGQSVRFRALGEPRPAAQTFSFDGDQVAPLPVAPRGSYNTLMNGGGAGTIPVYRTYPGTGVRDAVPGYGRTPGYTPAPLPRVVSPAAPRAVYTAPPPSVHVAPPPAAATSSRPH